MSLTSLFRNNTENILLVVVILSQASFLGHSCNALLGWDKSYYIIVRFYII